MRFLRAIVFGFLVLAGLTLAGGRGLAADFRADSFSLKNGLQVVVIVDHRAPVVTQMLWYKVGSADEPPGKSGVAHVLEHLMFKGTVTVPAGEFSRIVARNGGRDNAFTSQDVTAYFQNVAVGRLELVMRLEADRMVNLQLTPAVFAPELQVVTEERRMRTENQPAARLGEQMNAVQYLVHPYRIPPVGWMSELGALQLDDALAVYHRFYAPNNAILVIAGDVTTEQVRGLAETYFGPIPARDMPARTRAAEPPQTAARRVVLRDRAVRQPRWVRTYLAPSSVAGEKQHALALTVLADVLGGGTTSRLYKGLVVEQKIAAAAGAFYDPERLDLTTFGVYAVPVPGPAGGEEKALAAVEAAVEAEIDKMRVEGPGEAELKRAKFNLVAAATYARDSLGGMAQMYGSALAIGETIDDIVDWPARIDAVTAADVKAAAGAVLQARRSVTGEILPPRGQDK